MVLVFDYDGTIHDTKRLYGNAFRNTYDTLVKSGHAPEHYYSDDHMAHYLGMSPPVMWRTFMPDLPEELRMATSKLVREGMISGIKEGKAILYPGATEALDALRAQGYTMVILSNCYHAYLEAHREYFGLDQWFTGFYCAEDHAFKPKEEIFCTLREEHPDTSYIVIGDRMSDFKVGLAHKLPVIGCAYGFGTEEELRSCDEVAESPEKLPELIRKLAD